MSDLKTGELKYIVTIEPLGFLYGSAGKFLSPENLVGRSGTSFPPSAATLSGVFAASLGNDKVQNLCVAGPFWGETEEVKCQQEKCQKKKCLERKEREQKGQEQKSQEQKCREQNFYVPTPLTYLVKNQKIQHKLSWYSDEKSWLNENKESSSDKFDKGTWMAIADWPNYYEGKELAELEVKKGPWKPLPHLHPRLDKNQRRVVTKDSDGSEVQGSLFLENAMQMEPDTCLVYLSSKEIDPGWYRFGGEGHMVEIDCIELNDRNAKLLNQKIQTQFAIITPAVWGSNRLSYREPILLKKGNPAKYKQEDPEKDNECVWDVTAIYTARPNPFRYRLGNRDDNQLGQQPGQPKLLSRGRYAVPAGTVYVLEKALNKSWNEWPECWFPKEGPSLKHWGCGLALPL